MTIPSNETIEKAKKGLAERKPTPEVPHGSAGDFNLQGYLDHYGIQVIKIKNNGQGAVYVLKQCPFNPEHNSGEVHVSIQNNGPLGFACKHNSCSQYHWKDFREKISGQDSLSQFMINASRGRFKGKSDASTAAAPTMADLREYVDLCLVPGQKVTVDEICRGLSCYKREERKVVYGNLGRLCKEGILKKDDYRHGGYRRVIEFDEYDVSGDIDQGEVSFNIDLPLELQNFIHMKPSQLLQVSGRYDACKSSFLFQIEADNYQEHKIIHIISDEWSLSAIKERMDILGIPRPHENIKVIPMKPGYEDMIPSGPYIVLIDYIRADRNPFETDAQIQRILRNLDGGIAIFATQKHPGLDRPVGGQFAVHASHHILLLDRWKDIFTCKIYRTKNEKNLEGCFRTFRLKENMRLYPCMRQWKQGGK